MRVVFDLGEDHVDGVLALFAQAWWTERRRRGDVASLLATSDVTVGLTDDDGTHWLIYGCTQIVPLKPDLSSLAGEPVNIGPSNRKMGHEGCQIIKVGNKYVLFGTAWSTDKLRHGTYNLYYCTADKITGPYGPRQFAGRFLGHGTVFQDDHGKWWSTAFFNANVAPLKPEQLATKDLSDNAYTINRQGLTIVPMDIRVENGDVAVKTLDPAYAKPGPEEVQRF